MGDSSRCGDPAAWQQAAGRVRACVLRLAATAPLPPRITGAPEMAGSGLDAHFSAHKVRSRRGGLLLTLKKPLATQRGRSEGRRPQGVLPLHSALLQAATSRRAAPRRPGRRVPSSRPHPTAARAVGDCSGHDATAALACEVGRSKWRSAVAARHRVERHQLSFLPYCQRNPPRRGQHVWRRRIGLATYVAAPPPPPRRGIHDSPASLPGISCGLMAGSCRRLHQLSPTNATT